MTYSELKADLHALEAEHARREQAEDNYHRSGGYDAGKASIKVASDALEAVTVDMDGKTDVEILEVFMTIAVTASDHTDFEETGHVFPSKNYDDGPRKIRYGLLTWVADLLKTNSAPILDDVQRAIDVIPHYVIGWRLNCEYGGAYAELTLEDAVCYHQLGAPLPAIALVCCILQVVIVNHQPEVFKLPGTE